MMSGEEAGVTRIEGGEARMSGEEAGLREEEEMMSGEGAGELQMKRGGERRRSEGVLSETSHQPKRGRVRIGRRRVVGVERGRRCLGGERREGHQF